MMDYNYKEYFIKTWLKWIITAVVVLFLTISAITTYNGLSAQEQKVQLQRSQVENVMQRRADDLKNQVAVVKAYAKHEEKIFEDIEKTISVIYSSSDITSKLAADDQLSDFEEKLLELAQEYPELKSSEQFTNLQKSIEGSENRVAQERRRFIEAVANYNMKVKRFPGNIFAKLMGFETMDYFKADNEALKSPDINLD